MSHELEIVNGKAQMFSGEGITPWHGLGHVIEGLVDAGAALKLAGLDWTVDKKQLYTFDENGTKHLVKDRFATIRSTDHKALGIVSKDYHVYQNTDAFAFLNKITDTTEHEALFTTAGSLFGGSRTFMVLKLGKGFTVGDNDAHDLYLMATNSHDGSQAFTVSVTAIRAVCNNTVTLGLREAKTKYTIKHKVPLEGRAAVARDVLELGYQYEDAFEREVAKLMEIPMTKDKVHSVFDKAIPASPRQHDISVEEVMNIWENEPTVKMGGGEGNAWGAFNALTFWTDHKEYKDATSKFNSVIGTGTGQGLAEGIRPRAHKLLLAMA